MGTGGLLYYYITLGVMQKIMAEQKEMWGMQRRVEQGAKADMHSNLS